MEHVQVPPVESIFAADEGFEAVAAEVNKLLDVVWPGTPSRELEEQVSKWRDRNQHHFFVREHGSIIAHAAIFHRFMTAGERRLSVGCLAAVCVAPDQRGRNLGRIVTEVALGYLPKIEAEVALFQTPVPEFYRKLDCAQVHNEFYDRVPGPDPFWEPYRMIYPAHFDWPSGPVDINGPGF